MPEKSELGKIDKIAISELDKKMKKVLEIPFLLYRKSIHSSLPEEYDNKIDLFYDNLEEWLSQISKKIGSIKRIYMESITKSGPEAFSQVKKILAKNRRLSSILEKFLKSGAELEKTEDEELLIEYMAWVNDANSPDALEIDKEMAFKTKQERGTFISNRIKESLQENEIAVLFISFDLDQTIKYPEDVEVIKFRPSVIDDILKFLKKKIV
ncbi:MAG: hypothetical protein ACTSYB_06555 [Candidatus Helarchaeota archaeon]